MNHPPMGIVVVNFGSHGLIEANVPDLPDDYLIVIVDNWHSLTEREACRELTVRRGWRLVEMPDNAGFGRASNEGLRTARASGCTSLLVLNPDAKITPNVVDALRRHVDDRPTELVAPCIEDSAGQKVFVGVELLLRNGRMRRVGTGLDDAAAQLWLTAACLAFHHVMLDEVGGFAEDYFLYWEDVDLSVRAVQAGYTLAVRHDLVVVHDEGGTQHRNPDDRSKSDIYYRYNCRNRLRFASRHLSRRRQLFWLATTPAASWEILMRGGRRQLLRSRTPLWATLSGAMAGVFVVLRQFVRPRSTGQVRLYSSR